VSLSSCLAVILYSHVISFQLHARAHTHNASGPLDRRGPAGQPLSFVEQPSQRHIVLVEAHTHAHTRGGPFNSVPIPLYTCGRFNRAPPPHRTRARRVYVWRVRMCRVDTPGPKCPPACARLICTRARIMRARATGRLMCMTWLLLLSTTHVTFLSQHVHYMCFCDVSIH
jgi:hypothetical protein